MTQKLGNRQETMFFKTDEKGNDIGSCFRVLKFHNDFMIQSNNPDTNDFIESYLKENRKNMFPTIFEDENESFEFAQKIATLLNFKPFIN